MPELVEEYLRDLPELIGSEVRVREYETVPEPCTEDNPLGVYALAPDRIRYLADEELKTKRLAAEAARGARFRGLYARLGLRAAVHLDGTVEITVAATNTKGVMPCDGSGLRSNTFTRT